MLKRFSVLTCIAFLCFFCYGQEHVSIERAVSLSNMADFYNTAHSYEKAIGQEKKALEMKGKLYGKHSLEYATSAFNLAKYYYNRGIESENVHNNKLDFVYATEFVKQSIDIIKDIVVSELSGLDYSSRYQFWQNVNTIFDSTYPSYVARAQNDSTLSDLYNVVLFSKGISWRKDIENNTLCWKDIQNALGENDIAIEFISPVVPTNDNMVFYALTIKKGENSPKMIELFDILQLGDTLRSCNTKAEKNLKIGRMVWGPLYKELYGIKNIYFSATHVLNNFAIEYMLIDDKESYNDRYCMFRLSSTLEIAKRRTCKYYSNAILYGGLQYEPIDLKEENESKRSGFEPLPYSGEEVVEIAKIFEKSKIAYRTYTGENGTESSFISLSGSDIDLLHLSTHGMYITNNDVGEYHDGDKALTNSLLIFSEANTHFMSSVESGQDDGIITALNIVQMDFENLDIVTLSACESAMGEYGLDDSIMGLQRGFKIAGANTILMSIDKVDDEATKILMVEFYRNLMSGKTKLQSLKDAQIYLRQVEDGKYDKPEYWASFILLDGIN